METVEIGNSGRRTSQLGFGCSSVMGALGRRPSLQMLESAFDSGIRHFDVAPMYGYGEAEACLGDFLKHHPEATVATKFGIEPARKGSLMGAVRTLARPIVQLLPGAKKRLAQVAGKVSGKSQKASFTAAQAQASLERSLNALQRDHIDLWLLHEVEASDLDASNTAEGEALLPTLEGAVASGKVGRFGIGSGREKVPALLERHPAFCATQQYEWSVLDPLPEPSNAFRIHHRTLTEKFRGLHAALSSQPELAGLWSQQSGADLRSPEVLAQVMMKAALVLHPRSIILFSSKNPGHIQANARLAGDPALADAARTFYALVQANGAPLLAHGHPTATRGA